MNKAQALEKAAAALHAAKQAQERVALYAVTFGGSDQITQRAIAEHEAAIQAHDKWMDVAHMHPSTRARLIREQSLPSFMFGY